MTGLFVENVSGILGKAGHPSLDVPEWEYLKTRKITENSPFTSRMGNSIYY